MYKWVNRYTQVTRLVITKVWSASFGLVLHAHHIFANSVNFLVTWGLPVTVFHFMCIFYVYSMALYWSTLQFYVCVCVYVLFVCRYMTPLVSVITTLYYVAKSIFHRWVWYRALSLAMRVFEVQASSSSPRLLLCQISFLSRPPLLG